MLSARSRAHHLTALCSGAACGLASAHVDILYKLLRMNFEWFEFYLIALYSSVLCGILFLALSLILEAIFLIQRAVPEHAEVKRSYQLASLSFGTFLVLISVFTVICENSHIGHTALGKIGFVVISLLVCLSYWQALQQKRGFLNVLSRFLHSPQYAKLWSAYGFAWVVFILSGFVVDLARLQSNVRHLSSKRVKDKPNVILITLDTLRADHLSLYGYHRHSTPNLQHFANEAVVFEKATSPSSWTLPAHASMFTGKLPREHGATARYQKLDDHEITIAEILSSEGYVTAGFVAGPYAKGKFGLAQGFSHYSDRLDFYESAASIEAGNIRKLLLKISDPLHDFIFRSDQERSSEEINHKLFDWIDTHARHRFFLFVNYFDVHDPYNLGEPYEPLVTEVGRDGALLEKLLYAVAYRKEQRYKKHSPSVALKQDIVSRYDGEVRYLDRQLGELFSKLKHSGLWDESVIIVTSDHGEEFFDHGGVYHTYTLFQELLHVPLLIHFPEKFKAKRVGERVGTIDLFPTILDLVGLEAPKRAYARSLLPLLEDRPYSSRAIVSEYFGRSRESEISLQALTEGNWKLLKSDRSTPRTPHALFELSSDPKELQNRYESDVEIRAQLERKLQ